MVMMIKHLLLVILTVFTWISPAAAQDGAPFDFPHDHRLHEAAQDGFVEWLYFTGFAESPEYGLSYAFQVTLFQGRIGAQTATLQHVSLIDLVERRHIFYDYVPFMEGDAPAGKTSLEGARWTYEDARMTIAHDGTADRWEIRAAGTAQGTPIAFDLTLTNGAPGYIAHGKSAEHEQGEIGMGPCDKTSAYYSHPHLITTGAITVGDLRVPVTGATWFDHQWGTFRDCPLTWNWFSLRMDDGSALMLFDFTGAEAESLPEKRVLTRITPDGRVQRWSGHEAGTLIPFRRWVSPRDGKIYTLEWLLKTPAGDFVVVPEFDEQTMNTREKTYWEGAVRVRQDGDVIGRGFMEIALPPLQNPTAQADDVIALDLPLNPENYYIRKAYNAAVAVTEFNIWMMRVMLGLKDEAVYEAFLRELSASGLMTGVERDRFVMTFESALVSVKDFAFYYHALHDLLYETDAMAAFRETHELQPREGLRPGESFWMLADRIIKPFPDTRYVKAGTVGYDGSGTCWFSSVVGHAAISVNVAIPEGDNSTTVQNLFDIREWNYHEIPYLTYGGFDESGEPFAWEGATLEVRWEYNSYRERREVVLEESRDLGLLINPALAGIVDSVEIIMRSEVAGAPYYPLDYREEPQEGEDVSMGLTLFVHLTPDARARGVRVQPLTRFTAPAQMFAAVNARLRDIQK